MKMYLLKSDRPFQFCETRCVAGVPNLLSQFNDWLRGKLIGKHRFPKVGRHPNGYSKEARNWRTAAGESSRNWAIVSQVGGQTFIAIPEFCMITSKASSSLSSSPI
jgi:hypothetical protein